MIRKLINGDGQTHRHGSLYEHVLNISCVTANKLTAWNDVILEQIIVTELVRKFPALWYNSEVRYILSSKESTAGHNKLRIFAILHTFSV